MKELNERPVGIWFAIFIAVCLLLLSLRFAFGQQVEINDARRFMEIDQPQNAMQLLNKAVLTYPNDAALWYHLGTAQIKNGERGQALKSFEKGMAVDIKEPLCYVGRGYLSMLENNPQKAKLDFANALSITKSKNIKVLQSVAEAYLTDANLVNEALSLLLKAKALNEQDAETFILLGDVYLKQNSGGLAVSSYENAALLDKKIAKPYYKIGLVYHQSHNYSVAIEAFRKAIEIDPEYTLAYKELGELYYQLKEGDKAVDAYKKYLSLTGNPEIGKLRYAFFLFMARDFAKANETFRELAQKEDVSPITLRFYAISLFEAGDYQQSRNIFEQYFAKSPPTEIEPADYSYYGKLFLKQNEDSLAAHSFQRSLVLERKQPEVLQLLAETFFKSKKYPEAIGMYEQLMELRPKPSSQDYFTLGRAYYFNKQFEKADTMFQKLIELQPNMTVGYLWEARAKSNLDPESENGLAKPYYEKLIEKASATPEKNKNDLVEAYSYLGYYHFLKQETLISKSYWQKVLSLNPDDVKAKEALKALN